MLNILTLILYSLAFGLAITTNSFILIFLLISIFFLIFIFFLVFNVNFLALSFLIVYIGAIAILFLFAVMLLGQQTTKEDTFSISLKLFLFTLFSTVLALFFMRIFPYWLFNKLAEANAWNENDLILIVKNSSLANQNSNNLTIFNGENNPEVILRNKAVPPSDSIERLRYDIETDWLCLFNESLDFLETNIKSASLLDIYSISSNLYEGFSVLFIISGLLLLIAMLAVVGLIVPPKNKTMKN